MQELYCRQQIVKMLTYNFLINQTMFFSLINPKFTSCVQQFNQFPLRSSPPPQKKVHFSDEIKLILIPQCKDYHNAGLTSQLWFSQAEFFAMKQATIAEISIFKETRGLNINDIDAVKMLYNSPEEALDVLTP